MSAEQIMHTVLTAATAVTAVVGARIYPGELPQGTAMPALGISHISTVQVPRIDASAPQTLVQSRIEVTVLSKDYVALKDLVNKVRAAGNYQRGTIDGFSVVSMTRETIGPDMRDSDLTLFTQTVDFVVVWFEPNP